MFFTGIKALLFIFNSCKQHFSAVVDDKPHAQNLTILIQSSHWRCLMYIKKNIHTCGLLSVAFAFVLLLHGTAASQSEVDPATGQAAPTTAERGSITPEAEPEFFVDDDRLITGSVTFADERGGTYSRQSPFASAEQGYAEPEVGRLERRQEVWQAEHEQLIEIPNLESIGVAGETGGTYSRQSPIESAEQGYAAPDIERLAARQRAAQDRGIEFPIDSPERAQWAVRE